ncbi:MAG TPA: peptidylprolyl isomerase [Methylophilaceae bacterium]|jgi:peptidyl-prolyl cis-trans isomerase C
MKLIKSTVLALTLLGAVQTAQAADSVATVNGKPIKQSLYDYISKDAAARGQPVDDNVRKVIIDKLISSELIYQEAQRLGLDKQPDFLAQAELTQRELLVNTYLADFIRKNPISEARTKAAYEQLKKELGDKEYKASHILVATENEARDIIAQLNKGGDFSKIAKEKSNDPGSRENGGDLGWFSPNTMVKPFSDATVALKKGAITTKPVQTQFGWHVIKLQDVRTAQPPAYEKVKPALEQQLQQEQLEKMLSDLRAKAKIVTN